MKFPTRAKRWLACTAAVAITGTASALMVATPAQAAFPATIKICNSIDSSETNGGSTDGKNIDVDRLPGSSYGTYSNELLPGDCTGNVNDPANVRIDLTDDGVNFVPNGSAEIGKDNDGIDDTQASYDMPCQDTATISNENALPPTETLANAVSGGQVQVLIRNASVCGANLSDRVRTCNDASSTKTFDVFKMDGGDAGTDLDYNNELPPGECSNWKDADGLNPLRIDLSDDLANGTIEWKDTKSVGPVVSDCERSSVMSGSDVGTNGEDYTLTDYATDGDVPVHATHTIRVYNDGTAAGTMCGVTAAADVDDAQDASGLPTANDQDPAPTDPTPAWVASSTPGGPYSDEN